MVKKRLYIAITYLSSLSFALHTVGTLGDNRGCFLCRGVLGSALIQFYYKVYRLAERALEHNLFQRISFIWNVGVAVTSNVDFLPANVFFAGAF